MAEVPVPSAGASFFVAEPASTVTVADAVDMPPEIACPVETRLLAVPVALDGTDTIAPASVVTVLDVPFTVTIVPLGEEMVVPAGTRTEVLAASVNVVPGRSAAGADVELLAPLPPPQAVNVIHIKHHNMIITLAIHIPPHFMIVIA
jgi:hypothetical protein